MSYNDNDITGWFWFDHWWLVLKWSVTATPWLPKAIKPSYDR